MSSRCGRKERARTFWSCRGAGAELEARLRDSVSRRLAELGVVEPRVEVERRGALSRSTGGKLQLVVADPAARR